jgi:uncharacterized repeat protein (TIGR04138 family)
MTMHYEALEELSRRDPRYDSRAYEFVQEAIRYTEESLGRQPPEELEGQAEAHGHVSGRELLEGICDLALREYGLMARTVFRMWGVERTDDFGEIVFNLVEANLISTDDKDSRADFHNVMDLDEVLIRRYQIPAMETE